MRNETSASARWTVTLPQPALLRELLYIDLTFPQKILASLQPLKSSLLFVKVKVHRLAASKDDPQNLLTASVHDLYNTWDTLYERYDLASYHITSLYVSHP